MSRYCLRNLTFPIWKVSSLSMLRLDCVWHFEHGRRQSTQQSTSQQPAVAKTREALVINDVKYERDEWTNVTPKIISHVGRNLHLQRHHPLSLIKRRIVNFMYSAYRNPRGNPLFSIHENICPVVTVRQNFDSLLVPKDHPSRSKSDTYYVNAHHVLRAHTSAHQWELVHSGLDNFLVIGDVYRRDAIDSSHYPVFHQVEGVRLFNEHEVLKDGSTHRLFENGTRTDRKQQSHTEFASVILEEELKDCVAKLARSLFGNEVEYRWVEAYFPFTHPSWELEILLGGQWVEMLGCGVVEQELLVSAGANDKIGWAFGLGLERLAMKLYDIPDIRLFWSQDSGFLHQFVVEDPEKTITYKPVSIYPQCVNDMSFWIPPTFHPSDFYDLVRTIGGEIVEQVSLVDEFQHPRIQKTSHCYRIIYRHLERTLFQKEVNILHEKIATAATELLKIELR